MSTETTIDPRKIAEALGRVKDEASFISELLAATLNWPIPEDGIRKIEDITYDWPKDARKAPNVDKKLVGGSVKEVNLTGPLQHWGIFILEFKNPAVFDADRGMTGVLREVLRWLVPSRSKAGDARSWDRSHLLFICTHDYAQFRFAYFKKSTHEGGQSRLAAFGWHHGSAAVRTVCEFNLSRLSWPDNPADEDKWIQQWASAFDVERVSKKFYKDYAAEFDKFRSAVKELAGEEQKMFAQALMNRLMFLRFIERKGWLHPPGGGDEREYLRELFARRGYRSKGFYHGRLRKLFFEALAIEGKQESEAIGKAPFLNGGLFEESELDKKVTEIDDDAFAPLLDPEGLFYRYNFTVQESTPLNVEVAVDPEMLGKVFEELVTGRHESGSYYTPRPIVSYMCREALKGYLSDKTDLDAEKITAFVDKHETPFGINDAKTLAGALDEVRAVDPACGSGAYLLGLLHEIVDLYRLLYSDKLKTDDRELHRIKLDIIEKSLYGVDIDPFATNIAMLRLWLSLTVDSDSPRALPNLDFKIETADSLTGPDPQQYDRAMFLQERAVQLAIIKGKYMRASGDEKRSLRRLIQKEQREIGFELRSLYPGAIDWRVQFCEIFFSTRAGFDIVLANPPYVRHELIKSQKDTFKKLYPEVYGGTVDLCCYFYARAVQLLAAGGILAFISSNKWMRAGYGENLREFLRRRARAIAIIDFGHSPVFPVADTFPCVAVLARRPIPLGVNESAPEEEIFAACLLPREHYQSEMSVSEYVARHQRRIPAITLRAKQWTLDDVPVQTLIDRLIRTGRPLSDYVGHDTYFGIKTGYNQAFYIDCALRDRLREEEPQSARYIHPLLRGRNLRRWTISPDPESIIAIPSSENVISSWSCAGSSAESVFAREHPQLYRHLLKYRNACVKRTDQGRFWWELRSCAYYDVLAQPKIAIKRIAFHSEVALDTSGAYANDSTVFISSSDRYLLGVLNSPVMWWLVTRILAHKKDEALAMDSTRLDSLPIPDPSAPIKSKVAEAVGRLIKLSATGDSNSRTMHGRHDEIRGNELMVSDLIDEAFGLTPDERNLIRATHTLREPLAVLDARIAASADHTGVR